MATSTSEAAAQVAVEEIPARHKACIYDKPGEISTKVVEVDTPEPAAGEVLIHLTHSGVCHSDMGIMEKSWEILPYPTQPGQIGGHEGVGRIVKFGPGNEKSKLKVGDRVGVKWVRGACGNCLQCFDGGDALCKGGTISGYFSPGTFQQYCSAPAAYVTPIPDSLESADAAPMLCAGVTTYAALRRTGARSGQWVVISGAGGGLGHIACQLASRGMGLRVIGIDAGSKEQIVKDCGAEHFIDVTKHNDESLANEVREKTDGLGANAVLVCTASNKAYAQALDFLRFRGTMVCIGIPEGASEPIAKSYPQTLVSKEATITAVIVGSRRDASECMDFASRGIVKARYKIEKLENLTQAFQDLKAANVFGRIVIDLQ